MLRRLRFNFVWTSLAIVALISTFIFIGGFFYATNQIIYPEPVSPLTTIQPQVTPVPSDNPEAGLRILALGDSLTAGTGDNTGTGYVGHVKQKLEEQTGQPVYIMNNLAVPGSVTVELVTQLAKKSTQEAIAEADIVLLSIGGNDLFQGGVGIFDLTNPEQFRAETIAERTPEALKQVNLILTAIHESNPNAQVVYFGLYHPFLNIDQGNTGAAPIQAWNGQVASIISNIDNMYLVPTYDLFVRQQDRFLADDHFHPNGDGYERVATRIVQILK